MSVSEAASRRTEDGSPSSTTSGPRRTHAFFERKSISLADMDTLHASIEEPKSSRRSSSSTFQTKKQRQKKLREEQLQALKDVNLQLFSEKSALEKENERLFREVEVLKAQEPRSGSERSDDEEGERRNEQLELLLKTVQGIQKKLDEVEQSRSQLNILQNGIAREASEENKEKEKEQRGELNTALRRKRAVSVADRVTAKMLEILDEDEDTDGEEGTADGQQTMPSRESDGKGDEQSHEPLEGGEETTEQVESIVNEEVAGVADGVNHEKGWEGAVSQDEESAPEEEDEDIAATVELTGKLALLLKQSRQALAEERAEGEALREEMMTLQNEIRGLNALQQESEASNEQLARMLEDRQKELKYESDTLERTKSENEELRDELNKLRKHLDNISKEHEDELSTVRADLKTAQALNRENELSSRNLEETLSERTLTNHKLVEETMILRGEVERLTRELLLEKEKLAEQANTALVSDVVSTTQEATCSDAMSISLEASTQTDVPNEPPLIMSLDAYTQTSFKQPLQDETVNEDRGDIERLSEVNENEPQSPNDSLKQVSPGETPVSTSQRDQADSSVKLIEEKCTDNNDEKDKSKESSRISQAQVENENVVQIKTEMERYRTEAQSLRRLMDVLRDALSNTGPEDRSREVAQSVSEVVSPLRRREKYRAEYEEAYPAEEGDVPNETTSSIDMQDSSLKASQNVLNAQSLLAKQKQLLLSVQQLLGTLKTSLPDNNENTKAGLDKTLRFIGNALETVSSTLIEVKNASLSIRFQSRAFEDLKSKTRSLETNVQELSERVARETILSVKLHYANDYVVDFTPDDVLERVKILGMDLSDTNAVQEILRREFLKTRVHPREIEPPKSSSSRRFTRRGH